MDAIMLQKPPAWYPKRFTRFLWLLVAVRGLEPKDRHLWRIMDGVAFQDTETALETALFNEGREVSPESAERLTLAITKEEERRGARRTRKKAANEK